MWKRRVQMREVGSNYRGLRRGSRTQTGMAVGAGGWKHRERRLRGWWR